MVAGLGGLECHGFKNESCGNRLVGGGWNMRISDAVVMLPEIGEAKHEKK